jgi:hypothetical protein
MISVNDLLKDSSLNPLLMQNSQADDYGRTSKEINPNASFVASLYTSVLNRAPTPQELTSGMNYINASVGYDETGNPVTDPNAKNQLLQNIFKQGQNNPDSNAYGAKSVSFDGLYQNDRDADMNPMFNGDLLFKNKDGSQVGVDSASGKAIAARAPFSAYSGSGVATTNATNYNWNGQNVPVTDEGGGFGKMRYQSDPKGNIYLNANGDPVVSKQDLSSMSGFGDWMIENGWMLPVAMASAGAGLYALGADAAAGGLAAGEVAGETGAAGGAGDVFAGFSPTGSVAGTAGETVGSYGAAGVGEAGAAGGGADIGLGTNAPLQGPTYGELGVTGVPEGGAGPTYGEMGYTGLNQNEAIAAADAASQKAALVDALKTANQVRQGVGTANTLSKLLSQGAGSGLSSSLGQLAKGANPQGQALTPLVRGNTNPFAYTAQQPIQNAKPMDLSSLANLLKQG